MDKRPFPDQIEAERLVLRKHEISFAEAMFGRIDQERERLRVFLPWVDASKTVDDTISYIKRSREEHDSGTGAAFGMYDRASGVYMGNIGVHAVQWDHACCELGYWILEAFEGKGYVSEAVRVLERACFELGFHRVEIRCSSLNERSASVPRRLGYSLDGNLRENSIEHGRYRDTLVFGKLNPA